MSQVLRLTDRNFNQEVFQGKIPELVEFSASWCLPSQQQRPVLEELAKEYSGRLKIGELNVDQNPRDAVKYKIVGCPTFIILNSGKVIHLRIGEKPKKQLLEMIKSALKRGQVVTYGKKELSFRELANIISKRVKWSLGNHRRTRAKTGNQKGLF